MTELVACLSSGKGTWAHVQRLIDGQEWEKIFLITNDFGKQNFKANEKTELIVIDPNRFLPELVEDIKNALKGKITGIEVAVNFISGSGKEHMALMSAVQQLGVGLRLVALTKEGVKEV
ncbi:hypothetical protein KY360_03170 [Candidatus Woesearchaeota archaeon]|nr:hypothetical protein [Candidatus Woesearchaeota archaeon]